MASAPSPLFSGPMHLRKTVAPMIEAASHALTAFLWCECDPDGEPWDCGDGVPSPELEARIEADWLRFLDGAEALGFDAEEHCARMLPPDCDGDPWNAAAHDFILTRGHHGTGFWEAGRWAPPWGDRLTTLAHSFGELYAYRGEDGSILPDGGVDG